MTTASPQETLDEVLAGPLGRDNFDTLVERIYESYTSVDLTHNRIQQMKEKLEKASGDKERDLAEKLGVLQFAMGEYADAAETLDRVSARKNAAHFLGRALLRLDREEEALDYLEKGRSGDDDVFTDMLIVEAHCRLGDFEAAEKVLDQHPDDEAGADLEYARGRAAETRGEYAEAIAHYRAALEEDDKHARSLFRLAFNCDLNGDDRDAIELYERCVNLRPTFVGALINLGILYEDYGRYQDAIDCYKRVLAIDPHHEQARLYLKDAESSMNMFIDVGKSRRLKRLEEIFSIPVSNFELSARSQTCLERLDIRTLGGLTQVTPDDLLNEKNFGDTSLGEIEGLLARYNLELGDDLQEAVARKAEEKEREAAEEKLGMPVEELDFSTRGRRCLERLGISTVGELVQHTEQDLLSCPNFGETSLQEVTDKLAELGLSLKSE
ncbi:MAG: DNA-directed RNA polymerase subunit alpha C-terminal domain-containing protein [Candidatus Brocadiia bacterium]